MNLFLYDRSLRPESDHDYHSPHEPVTWFAEQYGFYVLDKETMFSANQLTGFYFSEK